jgi:hypothetical protein
MIWIDAFYFLVGAVGLALFAYGFRSTRRLESSFFRQVMEDDPSRDSEDARRHTREATSGRKPGQRRGPGEAALRLRERWPEETSRLQRARLAMRVGWDVPFMMSAIWAFWTLEQAGHGVGLAYLALFLVFAVSGVIGSALKVWE